MGKRLDRIGDVLVNRRLHFADPARFNDPFDCALGIDLHHGGTTEDWVEYFIHLVEEDEPDSTPQYRQARAEDNVRRERYSAPAFLDEAEKGIRHKVKEFGSTQGVLCLSSDPRNVMMWAHYAGNHGGLVLCFDTRYMGNHASGELRCFQVKYGLSFPNLPEYLEALRALRDGDNRAFNILFFCRKSRDWIYEKEWRFFANKPDSFIEFDPPMLSGIIFGWKMTQYTRQLVTAWAASLTCQPRLLQAEPCENRFRMNISAIAPEAQQMHTEPTSEIVPHAVSEASDT